MWFYEIYLINASKIWLFCILHTNLLINRKKKRFHVQNCPCGTVGQKKGYVLGKVVIEFHRKVFLIDCLLWKTLNMVQISITERTYASVFIHMKKPSITIQGNIKFFDEESKWRHSVVFFLLHIRANLGMMLARDYASCHMAISTVTCNACSKQRTKTQMACIYRPLWSNFNEVLFYMLGINCTKLI